MERTVKMAILFPLAIIAIIACATEIICDKIDKTY